MRAHRAIWPVATQCRVLNVSVSGYYAWLKRPPCDHAHTDIVIGDALEVDFERSRWTYGRPRLADDVRDAGIRTSGKRLARLMRERHIHGASRRKGFKTTVRDRDARPAPDLVDRNFSTDAPDKLWVADITLRADLEWLLVLSRCARCLQPSRGWLGDGDTFAYEARARRP